MCVITFFISIDISIVGLSLFTLNPVKYKVIKSGKELEVYEYSNTLGLNDFSDLFAWRVDFMDNKSIEERYRSSKARTKNRLRRLIASNVGEWGQPPILVTYTFKENIKSVSYANRLFRNYTQRINRFFGFKLKYVSVIEFQKRGAVHYHVIYFNLPFLQDITLLEKVWGLGMTKVESVRKVGSMGVYLSKYLQKTMFDVRLIGKKCYSASKGLVKPVEKRVDNLIDSSFDFSKVRLKKDVVYQVGSFGNVHYKRYN